MGSYRLNRISYRYGPVGTAHRPARTRPPARVGTQRPQRRRPMPTTYNVITTIGIDTVTADRCRKDEHGDIQFYNGSRDTPPVGEFIRENTVAVLPEGEG